MTKRSRTTSVTISGRAHVSVSGDIVGGDKVAHTTHQLQVDQVNKALHPIRELVNVSGAAAAPEAEHLVELLAAEIVKGKKASEGRLAKLTDRLVELVPGAVVGLGKAFASPVIAGLVGPATALVLKKLGLNA